MKKQINLFVALLAVTLLVTSCGRNFYTDGVGDPVTEEFFLDDFDGFIIDGSMDVRLSQGPEQRVFVTAQPNLIDLINTNVVRGEWKIDYIESVRTSSQTIIEITLPDIRSIVIDGSGDVVGLNALDLRTLDILIDGSGDVELFGEVDKQFITIDGSGNVDNFDLLSFDTDIEIDGSGDVSVHADEFLRVNIDGSGDVRFTGDPDIQLTDNGSGDLIDAN